MAAVSGGANSLWLTARNERTANPSEARSRSIDKKKKLESSRLRWS